jgi:hypothetical protein
LANLQGASAVNVRYEQLPAETPVSSKVEYPSTWADITTEDPGDQADARQLDIDVDATSRFPARTSAAGTEQLLVAASDVMFKKGFIRIHLYDTALYAAEKMPLWEHAGQTDAGKGKFFDGLAEQSMIVYSVVSMFVTNVKWAAVHDYCHKNISKSDENAIGLHNGLSRYVAMIKQGPRIHKGSNVTTFLTRDEAHLFIDGKDAGIATSPHLGSFLEKQWVTLNPDLEKEVFSRINKGPKGAPGKLIRSYAIEQMDTSSR